MTETELELVRQRVTNPLLPKEMPVTVHGEDPAVVRVVREFIGHAREDVLALLRHVEQLQDQVDRRALKQPY